MRALLLFVHGTGVREAGYAATLDVIERRVRDHLGVGASVRGCYWGTAEGARLVAGGKSIPGYAQTGGRPLGEADEVLALWSVLYTDPWYELRLLRHLPSAGPVPFGEEPPAEQLRASVDELVPSPALVDELRNAGLADYFDPALEALRHAPELDQAVATAPAEPLEHRRAIARALIAHAIVAAEDGGQPVPDGTARDRCVELLGDQLNAYGLGVGEFLLRPVKGVASWWANRKLRGDRGAITDSAGPLAGDVLRFLARGDGARGYIKNAITDLGEGPIYLLGHSLGGIMCVELLIREEIRGVAGLITVGSQSSFLYEIGALPGLSHPDRLPDHFPPWLNVYDRRDVLSYLCAGLFGDGVTDVEVDNGQPFPQSHSAYWTNPDVWKSIAEVVR